MTKSAVQKRQRSIGEIVGAAAWATREVEVNKEDEVLEVIDVTDPATSL